MLSGKKHSALPALGVLILTLALTACGAGDETTALDQAGIIRVIKRVNQSHNQGQLTMDQLREGYDDLDRYTHSKPLTTGVGAMGAFYAHNLGKLYREYVSLEEPEAFLTIHTTVKTGEAYIQNSSAFAGGNTLEALTQHQQELIERYRD